MFLILIVIDGTRLFEITQPYKNKNENCLNSATPIKQKFPSESKSKAFFFGALSFHLKEHLKCECNKLFLNCCLL